MDEGLVGRVAGSLHPPVQSTGLLLMTTTTAARNIVRWFGAAEDGRVPC